MIDRPQPSPSLHMKLIQRCTNCKRDLVLTEDGKCLECGQLIKKDKEKLVLKDYKDAI